MNDSKRFEEWTCKVDCEECERWWTNQCDGIPKDVEKRCNSYLATRKIVIPAKIRSLEKRVKWLRMCCILTDILIMLHLLSHLVGWA